MEKLSDEARSFLKDVRSYIEKNELQEYFCIIKTIQEIERGNKNSVYGLFLMLEKYLMYGAAESICSADVLSAEKINNFDPLIQKAKRIKQFDIFLSQCRTIIKDEVSSNVKEFSRNEEKTRAS